MNEPSVTIIVLTWNSKQDIDECLSSMLNQTYSNFSILVVDSSSTDDTAEYVRTRFPDITLVELATNEGYRRGNAIGMAMADGDFVVVCNDDVKVEPNWLRAMVNAMSNQSIGLVTPMILMADQPDIVNSAGNTLHYSGMYGPRGKAERRSLHESQQIIAAVSGCCFMIRRELLLKLNGFSSDFDRYNTGWHASFEDVDLGWRLQLLGYQIEYVPSAVMYHNYKQPGMFPARFASYEWGRYITILRNYELVTLISLAPLLFALELFAWIYAITTGPKYVAGKMGVMIWIIAHLKEVKTMRRQVQFKRVVTDAKILACMDNELNFSKQLGSGSTKVAMHSAFNKMSCLYYRAMIKILGTIESFKRSKTRPDDHKGF